MLEGVLVIAVFVWLFFWTPPEREQWHQD